MKMVYWLIGYSIHFHSLQFGSVFFQFFFFSPSFLVFLRFSFAEEYRRVSAFVPYRHSSSLLYFELSPTYSLWRAGGRDTIRDKERNMVKRWQVTKRKENRHRRRAEDAEGGAEREEPNDALFDLPPPPVAHSSLSSPLRSPTGRGDTNCGLGVLYDA